MTQIILEKQNNEGNVRSNDFLKHSGLEHCCTNSPSYEITYSQISRKWLVCNDCLEQEYFKTGIKEKVRISV